MEFFFSIGMLVDEKLATLQLVSGAKTDIAYKQLSEAGLQLTNEPFFKSLLVALYKERMQNLLKRARILLPTSEARLMIGVMDEIGILKPGQVRVVEYLMTIFSKNKGCLVSRSPFKRVSKRARKRGPVNEVSTETEE